MKKQIVLTFIIALAGLLSYAQERPGWIDVLPKPANTTYYYVHAKGSGRTDTEANKAAMNDLNRQILDYLGPAMEIKVEDNGETIYQIINGEQYRIQRKQVCDWSETAADSRTIQHYLFQVATRGNQEPIFDSYNCYPLTFDVKSLIPGWGQIEKGRVGLGVCFITLELAALGGAIGSYQMARKQLDILQNTNTNYTEFITAREKYNISKGVYYSCLVIVPLLYVGNLIVANVVTPVYRNSLAFNPVLMPTDNSMAMGLCLTYNF